jgi:hypothetical protein
MHPSIGCTQKADLAEILQKKGPCKSKVMRIKPDKKNHKIRSLRQGDTSFHIPIKFGTSPTYDSMVAKACRLIKSR